MQAGGVLGECEEAQGHQGTKQPTLLAQTHTPDGWQWWGRGGILEMWWSPWPETRCLWSLPGAQNEASEQELGRMVQLKTSSLCAQPRSSSDLKDDWRGLVWVEEGDTGDYLVCGSKSDCSLNAMDSCQLCCPETSEKRESGILARFLLELNSNCKLIHRSQTLQSLLPSLLCWIKVLCLLGVQVFFQLRHFL